MMEAMLKAIPIMDAVNEIMFRAWRSSISIRRLIASVRADDALLLAVMIREAIVGFFVVVGLLMAQRVLFWHCEKHKKILSEIFIHFCLDLQHHQIVKISSPPSSS